MSSLLLLRANVTYWWSVHRLGTFACPSCHTLPSLLCSVLGRAPGSLAFWLDLGDGGTARWGVESPGFLPKGHEAGCVLT
jgi:hypothetical protein